MAKHSKPLDLRSEGVRELIKLTNNQFKDWQQALARETTVTINAGCLMNYWFILSNLAVHGGDEFRMNKKDTFLTIPNLKPEAVRKHVATLGALGFVETVRSKKEVFLSLTPSGQRAVMQTMAGWIQEFGRLQRTYFREPS